MSKISWPDSTFVHAPADEHVHGDHWEPFADDDGAMELVAAIPSMLRRAIAPTGCGDGRIPSHAVSSTWRQGDVWVWPDRAQGLCMLVERRHDGQKELMSAFPFFADGSNHTVTIERVTIWDNGLEGQLTVTWGEATVTFFDTKFLLHRCFYEAGGRVDVVLTGVAFEVGPATTTEMTVHPAGEGMQTWSLRRATGLLPAGGDDDHYSFRGPVTTVSPIHRWLHQDGWKVRATIMRLDAGDAELDIVVTKRAWTGEAPPRVGDQIEGHLWLQGYLARVPL